MDINGETFLQADTRVTASLNETVDAGSRGRQLSSDFEVFLKMLTAQMQYQDPLNPIDSTDYATQLATFSGVEQAVLTNDLLADLSAQFAVGGLTDLAPWVGREARSDAPVAFVGQPIELFPKQMGLADRTEIIVRDSSGNEVQRMPYAFASGPVLWAGTESDGRPLPAGTYSFTSVNFSNGQAIGETAVETYRRITEVRIDNQTPVVVLEGGAAIPSSNVTALRDSGV